MNSGNERWDKLDGPAVDGERGGDEYAITLLRRLDDEPGGPSRVDLLRAIAEGRRRRKVRRIAGAGGAAALTVAMLAAVPVLMNTGQAPEHAAGSATSAHPAPTGAATASSGTASPGAPATYGGARAEAVPPPRKCGAILLEVPGGVSMSLVTGMDPTGRVILGRSYPAGGDGSYPMLIWRDGKPAEVKVPGDDQILSDADSTGVAVGWGYLDGGSRAFVVRDGRTSELLGGKSGQAVAINEAGRIAGTLDGSQPVVWPSESDRPVTLALPKVTWSGEAVDIDEDGTVVAAVLGVNGDDQVRAYLWTSDGSGRLLPLPTVQGKPAVSFRPLSVRNGWVTGLAAMTAGGTDQATVPVRYNLATGTFVDFPDLALGPRAGNAQGWVVGSTDAGHAGLLTDSGLLLLPDFAKPRESTSNLALAVSDDGRTIVGQAEARDGSGQPRAMVWRCQ
nr:hypothetical protein [Micromonospora sp. DSM 115978]